MRLHEALHILGLSLLALCAIASATVRSAEPTHRYFVTSDAVRIHYLELGSGVPVVLIHGYTGNAQGNWFDNGVAAALATKHRVVALDCRGHGRSDKPHDPKMYGERMAQDVIELMDHLRIERAHVHGYSMGGDIVTQLLVRHPQRLITAIYGGDGVEEGESQWIRQLPADSGAMDPQEAQAEAILESVTGQDRAALWAVKHVPGKVWGHTPINLRSVTLPVLAIVGELDAPNKRLTRMKRELRAFDYVILPGKSHLTAIMAGFIPPKYAATLVSFIEQHDPR